MTLSLHAVSAKVNDPELSSVWNGAMFEGEALERGVEIDYSL